jgi:meiotic recombination protein SPO11
MQRAKLIPRAKFHALVDADPHGIDIMQVYAKGSKSTTHSHDHAGLALGARLDWMGVKASEWLGLGVKHDDLLMLSDKDVEKVSYLPLS